MHDEPNLPKERPKGSHLSMGRSSEDAGKGLWGFKPLQRNADVLFNQSQLRCVRRPGKEKFAQADGFSVAAKSM